MQNERKINSFSIFTPDEQAIKLALGGAIRTIRKRKGLSQERVAELSGVHRTFFGNLERGVHSVSVYNLILISNALGVKPSEILLEMHY